MEVFHVASMRASKIWILSRLNPPHQDGGAYLSWSDLGGVNFLKLKLGGVNF